MPALIVVVVVAVGASARGSESSGPGKSRLEALRRFEEAQMKAIENAKNFITALKKEKILPEVKVNMNLKGKSFIEKYYKEEEIKKKFGAGQQKFTLASEVKSLSYL